MTDRTVTEQAEYLASRPTDPGLAAQALATLALAAQVGRIADGLEALVAGGARTVDLAAPMDVECADTQTLVGDVMSMDEMDAWIASRRGQEDSGAASADPIRIDLCTACAARREAGETPLRVHADGCTARTRGRGCSCPLQQSESSEHAGVGLFEGGAA